MAVRPVRVGVALAIAFLLLSGCATEPEPSAPGDVARISQAITDLIKDTPGVGGATVLAEEQTVVIYARQSDWSEVVRAEIDAIVRDAEDEGVHVELIDIPFGEGELADLVGAVLDRAIDDYGIDVRRAGAGVTTGTAWFSGPTLLDDTEAQSVIRELVAEIIGPEITAEFLEYEEVDEVVTADSHLS